MESDVPETVMPRLTAVSAASLITSRILSGAAIWAAQKKGARSLFFPWGDYTLDTLPFLACPIFIFTFELRSQQSNS